jgi:hypothetical protein
VLGTTHKIAAPELSEKKEAATVGGNKKKK